MGLDWEEVESHRACHQEQVQLPDRQTKEEDNDQEIDGTHTNDN